MENFYSLPTKEVLAKLETSEAGLNDAEAKKRLEKYGLNQLTEKRKISPFSIFLGQFKNVLTLILLASAFLILVIYFFGEKESSDLIEAGLIFSIVFLIAILGFVQEYKAEKAIASLKKLLAQRTLVKRNGKEIQIDVSQLVPGDLVILEEGMKIPADIRLLQVSSLRIIESSLTGESEPVRKISEEIKGTLQISDQKNMCFASTTVASGRAEGVVINTGDLTEIGKIADMVSQSTEEQTPIQKRLDDIGKMLGYIIVAICIGVFVFIVFFAHGYKELPLLTRILHSFIAAVALAVAAIPEGLPGVVTITLALGTQRMLKKNALVRKLTAIETLGSTDIICSDKTGTLTKGEMTVTQIFADNIYYDVEGTGYDTTGKFVSEGKETNVSKIELLLSAGALCNNAVLEIDKILGDPTEAALLVAAKKAGIELNSKRVHEIPFSSERKKMSVVVVDRDKYIVYMKGAPEVILDSSTQSVSKKEELLGVVEAMSAKALRVLGVSYKELSKNEYEQFLKSEEMFEKGMTFLGFFGMIDPPRTEVKALIEETASAGIRTILITGDHKTTAVAVGNQIGITGDVITGEELDELTPQEFKTKVETIGIYARVNPEHKMKIVQALKDNNHIVAMTGDGVNDAPALKRADIGIAMGITGTDVAKEASDMVLLDDHFATIVSSLREGRGIFQNIRKFVTYLLACNLGEVFIILFAILIFQDVPLTATMLLWINVVTDGLPALALGIDPAEKNIMKYSPKVFQSDIITKRLWFMIVGIGIILSVCVLGIYAHDLPDGLIHARSSAFGAIVLFELVSIFIIRSSFSAPFFSNKWLMISIAATVILQLCVMYLPFFTTLFELTPLGLMDWVMISVCSIFLWVFSLILKKIGEITFPE